MMILDLWNILNLNFLLIEVILILMILFSKWFLKIMVKNVVKFWSYEVYYICDVRGMIFFVFLGFFIFGIRGICL